MIHAERNIARNQQYSENEMNEENPMEFVIESKKNWLNS